MSSAIPVTTSEVLRDVTRLYRTVRKSFEKRSSAFMREKVWYGEQRVLHAVMLRLYRQLLLCARPIPIYEYVRWDCISGTMDERLCVTRLGCGFQLLYVDGRDCHVLWKGSEAECEALLDRLRNKFPIALTYVREGYDSDRLPNKRVTIRFWGGAPSELMPDSSESRDA